MDLNPGRNDFDEGGHPGVDLAPPEDETISSSGYGTVISSDECTFVVDGKVCPGAAGNSGGRFNGGYGNVLVVEYPYGSMSPHAKVFYSDVVGLQSGESLYFLYAHLKEAPLVDIGDEVIPGQALGEVGSTGNSTGPHLHLEIRIGISGSLQEGPMCTAVCYDTGEFDPSPILDDWVKMIVINPYDIFDIGP